MLGHRWNLRLCAHACLSVDARQHWGQAAPAVAVAQVAFVCWEGCPA